MKHSSFTVVAFATASLFAQDPPAAPPAATAPAVPAAGSPEATALLDKAIGKMQAYGRGEFKTSEASDNAMLRGQGLPFGGEDVEVEGGWHRELVWGDADGKDYVRANGRLLAKVGAEWRLRGSKLPGGRPVPFTLDPDLLFTVLASLPADARKVANVEAGEVAGKPVAILSVALEGDVAGEFAATGVVPIGGGLGGGFMIFGGGGGGMEMPENEYTIYLAFAVDADSGDLRRFTAKVFDTNAMMGNVQIQIAGGPGGDDEEEEVVEEEKPAAAGAPLVWKKGLPTKKPGKNESVTTFRADFKQLGLAEPPALDDKAKALLRVR